jgi:hypothetical protein
MNRGDRGQFSCLHKHRTCRGRRAYQRRHAITAQTRTTAAVLEGIEAIVLRTDLTLRKEILWESETMTNGD